jgi:hypothetical protein
MGLTCTASAHDFTDHEYSWRAWAWQSSPQPKVLMTCKQKKNNVQPWTYLNEHIFMLMNQQVSLPLSNRHKTFWSHNDLWSRNATTSDLRGLQSISAEFAPGQSAPSEFNLCIKLENEIHHDFYDKHDDSWDIKLNYYKLVMIAIIKPVRHLKPMQVFLAG